MTLARVAGRSRPLAAILAADVAFGLVLLALAFAPRLTAAITSQESPVASQPSQAAPVQIAARFGGVTGHGQSTGLAVAPDGSLAIVDRGREVIMRLDANGQPLAASFIDYALPTALRVPSIDPVLVEVPATDGPFGAKGVGEPPVVAGAAAIANAIAAATGARFTELPITKERLFRALSTSDSRGPEQHPAAVHHDG